jgi:hypothetical protein
LSKKGGDDAVRVPIEIKTDDLQEIQQLIQELTDAEEEIRKAKTEEKGALPRKGRARDGESRAPYEAANIDERGGIFGGTMEPCSLHLLLCLFLAVHPSLRSLLFLFPLRHLSVLVLIVVSLVNHQS